jgi:hypothetical protein
LALIEDIVGDSERAYNDPNMQLEDADLENLVERMKDLVRLVSPLWIVVLWIHGSSLTASIQYLCHSLVGLQYCQIKTR